jgi:hypothetical protein
MSRAQRCKPVIPALRRLRQKNQSSRPARPWGKTKKRESKQTQRYALHKHLKKDELGKPLGYLMMIPRSWELRAPYE